MTSNVSAVVLFHDESESLQRVLRQLENQTLKPSRVLVVDTSKNSQLPEGNFETLRLPSKNNFAQSINAAFEFLKPNGFLWILHDDSAPDSNALEHLVTEAELSPSLAVIGPKQVDWENPKIIRQLGLTLTRSGRLFSRVRGEFDQGQHDIPEDVLAVGTAGVLISTDAFRALNGFDPSAPQLASDVDFSIRARLQGFRVSVAPTARISHKMLSMQGGREIGWLGANPKTAIRKAELYLALSHLNPLLFLPIWLLLVPAAIANSLFLLARKRANDIPSEIYGALATFLDLGRILRSRSLIGKTTSAKLSSLSGLRATRAEVKADRQRAKDQLVSAQLLRAHAEGETSTQVQSGIISSGALWWALGLLMLNVLWIPTASATTGGGVLPLTGNWLEIFSLAGSQTTELGVGFSAPSDPFIWVLALVSLPTFFEPSLAITLILFLSPALAFLGAWLLTGLVSSKTSIKVIAGLAYALWPSLTISLAETRFTQVLVGLLLPWFLLAVAKVAALSTVGRYHSTWTNVGLAGILFALIASSSPLVGSVLLIGLIFLGLAKPKRAIAMLFVPLLAIAWWLPVLGSQIANASWLSLLVDPGVAQSSGYERNWQLPIFGLDSLQPELFIAVVILVFAALAILIAPVLQSSLLWGLGLLALAGAWFGLGVQFEFGDSPLTVDVNSALGLFGLALILLVATAMEKNRGFAITASIAVLSLGVLPAAVVSATNPPKLSYSDGRIVPSIIQAEADSGSTLRTLKLSQSEGLTVIAEVFSDDGVKLEDLSTRYLLGRAELVQENPDYKVLGQLVANLVSANGAEILPALQFFDIGYILVSPSNRDLQLALDSTRELESIGETDFGQVWKVKDVIATPAESPMDFGINKVIQIVVLAFFIVLSIPSSGARRRREKNSEIFVDAEES